MSDFDTIIRHATLITPDGESRTDIGIAEGKIAALDAELSGSARTEIDVRHLHIFPGVIDAHVHFNEPGRADWEGLETGSHALAAGGGTCFFDMPLNAHPPTCDVASFDLKAAAAQNKSLTDFALWGGLVPHNLEQIERLAERGVIGFKAFMSDSGIDDFPRADHTTLRKGMKRAASVGRLVAVHAESETITQRLAQEKMTRGMTSARDYLNSRPVEAELEAIRNAIDMAGDVGCKLHVVHVSSAESVALLTDAKKRGADVSCETCPHYLVLTENDTLKLGAVAKCAPPLRSPRERDALWERVLAGEITTIGSDHSPSPPEMKQNTNFFKVWGGISGVQHLLPLLIGAPESIDHFGSARPGEAPALSAQALSLVAKLSSFNVAERFGLPKTKGRIAVGADADFAVVDFRQKYSVRAEELFYRHKQSPYVGRTLTGRVVQTILRGQTIFKHGQIVSQRRGQLIKPV
jgi:allantoinase